MVRGDTKYSEVGRAGEKEVRNERSTIFPKKKKNLTCPFSSSSTWSYSLSAVQKIMLVTLRMTSVLA
jgi:hypothetical protein